MEQGNYTDCSLQIYCNESKSYIRVDDITFSALKIVISPTLSKNSVISHTQKWDINFSNRIAHISLI